jgi:hypothetical protein
MKRTTRQAKILTVSAVCAICAIDPGSTLSAMPQSQTQTPPQASTTAVPTSAVVGKS